MIMEIDFFKVINLIMVIINIIFISFIIYNSNTRDEYIKTQEKVYNFQIEQKEKVFNFIISQQAKQLEEKSKSIINIYIDEKDFIVADDEKKNNVIEVKID